MLKYPPFAASQRMEAAARNHHALASGQRGIAVSLLQGGLIQMGYSLLKSTKKGTPDGIYGAETVSAVKAFQAACGLARVDGIAGRETIVTLDALLANKAGMSFPVPLGPPSSPVDLNYELGTGDPHLGHDPGAGPWDSKPIEASYVALKQGIIEILPASMIIIGPDAAENMRHYFDTTGNAQTINLEKMVREVPSATKRYTREVGQMQKYVETLPPGTHPIKSRMAENGYNTKAENQNWYYAIGGYSSWGLGNAVVSGDAIHRTFLVDFEYKFYDRYNWDGGKSVTIHGITVTDAFMGEFHRQGLAREYDCYGSFKRSFSWKKGDPIPQAQLDGPGGR